MKTLIPSASACLIVALVASVSYAETQVEARDAETAQAEAESDASPRELSVAPSDHVEYPSDRPGWIQLDPDLESDVHSWVVVTKGHVTDIEAEDELRELQRAAVSLYIKELVDWDENESFVTDPWIEDELIRRRYTGELKQGTETLKEIAVELEFDEIAQDEIRRAYKDYREVQRRAELGDRLRATGGLFALGLFGLCCSGGLLGLISRRFS